MPKQLCRISILFFNNNGRLEYIIQPSIVSQVARTISKFKNYVLPWLGLDVVFIDFAEGQRLDSLQFV